MWPTISLVPPVHASTDESQSKVHRHNHSCQQQCPRCGGEDESESSERKGIRPPDIVADGYGSDSVINFISFENVIISSFYAAMPTHSPPPLYL